MNSKGQGEGLMIVIGAVVLILAIIAVTIIAIVPAGSVGVQDTFGNVSSDLLQSGFSFKSPVTGVVGMSVQTQKYDAIATSASSDLQDVSTEVAVNYRLDSSKAIQVYKTIGRDYANVVMTPAVQEAVKASTAQFTAEELITKRPLVKDEIENNLKNKMNQFGIIIDTINITDFKFSAQFTTAIEAKVSAQQSALQAENKLKQVEIEAQQKVATATGDASAIKITADAQAYQLQVINDKLTQNPLLVQYKAIEKWSGVMPLVTGGATPFVNFTQGDLNKA